MNSACSFLCEVGKFHSIFRNPNETQPFSDPGPERFLGEGRFIICFRQDAHIFPVFSVTSKTAQGPDSSGVSWSPSAAALPVGGWHFSSRASSLSAGFLFFAWSLESLFSIRRGPENEFHFHYRPVFTGSCCFRMRHVPVFKQALLNKSVGF